LQKQSSLLSHTQTKEEYDLVKCIQGSVRIEDLKDITDLLKVVSKWRLYVGLPKDDVSHELSIATDFIKKEYDHLTLEEIELAFHLSVTRRLDDVDFFGYFSPLYIGKVLNAFLYYRKKTLADAIRRKEKADYDDLERKSKPTPKEEVELTRDIFQLFYNQYKAEGEITDVFNLCYKYLRKVSFLNPDKQTIEDAMQYGREKIKKQDKGLFREVVKSADTEIQKFARNYCVQKYFDEIDINVLLNNIKEEHFA
jgi:hypothetical protein